MVCRIKNRHTFKSLPILNSAYFTECRFVIRHITQTDTETETEANFTHIFTVRQRSCGKVMFLHLSVILFTGGGVHPPGRHPLTDTPPRQTLPSPWADTPPPLDTQPLQRTVHILLKCIHACLIIMKDESPKVFKLVKQEIIPVGCVPPACGLYPVVSHVCGWGEYPPLRPPLPLPQGCRESKSLKIAL